VRLRVCIEGHDGATSISGECVAYAAMLAARAAVAAAFAAVAAPWLCQ
jgi:hypothetical protein